MCLVLQSQNEHLRINFVDLNVLCYKNEHLKISTDDIARSESRFALHIFI